VQTDRDSKSIFRGTSSHSDCSIHTEPVEESDAVKV
jgi:hypothetical protein